MQLARYGKMNEKKVREAIERVKNFPEWNRDDLWLGMEDMEELTETILEALEKQLPKKPVLKRNAYGGISVCQICGASDYGKYCRQCGQRVDREE